jgi:TM2 domain-containing membrane protein YozV
MKEKTIAGLLALFLGSFGIHRFYLGQKGLGFLYLIFAMTGIPAILGLIDAYIFFSMDQDTFDIKYNRHFFRAERITQVGRKKDRGAPERKRTEDITQNTASRVPQRGRDTAMASAKVAELKKNGVAKYKDYDFEGAIADFTKVLEYAPEDISVHFNLACAYSLTEQAEKAFFHLDKAVGLGFNDFERIKTHDGLAFLRIQPGFEPFEQRGYRIVHQIDGVKPGQDLLEQIINPNLLEQLRKLEELRGKGLLTDEEYEFQRRKITG